MRNLQEQVKKALCYQKLFWPFTLWMNCSSDLKNFDTVGQNSFGNKIPNFPMITFASNNCKCETWLSCEIIKICKLDLDNGKIGWFFLKGSIMSETCSLWLKFPQKRCHIAHWSMYIWAICPWKKWKSAVYRAEIFVHTLEETMISKIHSEIYWAFGG